MKKETMPIHLLSIYELTIWWPVKKTYMPAIAGRRINETMGTVGLPSVPHTVAWNPCEHHSLRLSLSKFTPFKPTKCNIDHNTGLRPGEWNKISCSNWFCSYLEILLQNVSTYRRMNTYTIIMDSSFHAGFVVDHQSSSWQEFVEN